MIAVAPMLEPLDIVIFMADCPEEANGHVMLIPVADEFVVAGRTTEIPDTFCEPGTTFVDRSTLIPVVAPVSVKFAVFAYTDRNVSAPEF
jgi:hypothetical protein